MKISKIAILALRGTGSEVKKRIAKVAGVSWQTVYTWIADNTDNSDLTKAAVVQVIADETGLTQDQILEDVTANSAAA